MFVEILFPGHDGNGFGRDLDEFYGLPVVRSQREGGTVEYENVVPCVGKQAEPPVPDVDGVLCIGLDGCIVVCIVPAGLVRAGAGVVEKTFGTGEAYQQFVFVLFFPPVSLRQVVQQRLFLRSQDWSGQSAGMAANMRMRFFQRIVYLFCPLCGSPAARSLSGTASVSAWNRRSRLPVTPSSHSRSTDISRTVNVPYESITISAALGV